MDFPGNHFSISRFQLSFSEAGQTINAGYACAAWIVASAWMVFPSPISSAMKVRFFASA